MLILSKNGDSYLRFLSSFGQLTFLFSNLLNLVFSVCFSDAVFEALQAIHLSRLTN